MKIPRWYRQLVTVWALTVVRFWWFAAAFNGESFFSLPKLAGPSDGEGWQTTLVIQIIIIAAMFLPPLIAPFAFFAAKREAKVK